MCVKFLKLNLLFLDCFTPETEMPQASESSGVSFCNVTESQGFLQADKTLFSVSCCIKDIQRVDSLYIIGIDI